MSQLSPQAVQEIHQLMKRYESPTSAVIPALYIVQREMGGWIPESAIALLSQIMGIPESHIQEVFQFYTLFNKRPVGRYHIQVCGTLSCYLNGAHETIQFLCDQFKVGLDQVSVDGLVSVSRVECLGACDKAPVALVNGEYVYHLTLDKAMGLLVELKQKGG